MQSLISIIIPIYKVEPYLKRCLDSVLNQTYTKLEIILVDDGSPDNCPTICDEYAKKDKRIIVVHQSNQGLSEARNTGIKLASGDYIYFVDSDDFVCSNTISLLYNEAIKNYADIVIGNYKSFFQHTDIEDKTEKRTFKDISLKELMIMHLPNNKHFTQSVVAWNKLFKANIVKQFLFPPQKICEDHYTTYKYFSIAKKIIITNTTTYFYLQREGSIVYDLKKNPLNDMKIQIEYLKERIDFFEKKSLQSIAVLFIPLFVKLLLYRIYLGNYENSLKKTDIEILQIYSNKLNRFSIPNFWSKHIFLYIKLQKIKSIFFHPTKA